MKHLQRFYFNFNTAIKEGDWGIKWSQISSDPKHRASLIVLWVTDSFMDIITMKHRRFAEEKGPQSVKPD